MEPQFFQHLLDASRHDRDRSAIRNPDDLRAQFDSQAPDLVGVLAINSFTACVTCLEGLRPFWRRTVSENRPALRYLERFVRAIWYVP